MPRALLSCPSQCRRRPPVPSAAGRVAAGVGFVSRWGPLRLENGNLSCLVLRVTEAATVRVLTPWKTPAVVGKIVFRLVFKEDVSPWASMSGGSGGLSFGVSSTTTRAAWASA